MAIKRRFHSIPMPKLKTISEKTTKHLFEVLPCELQPLYNAGWALKRYTHNFANIRLTVDFDTLCCRNMVGDCLIFKAYQCHVTIPTKLTIPPHTEDFYFSKYTLIYPWQSTVMLSVILSVIRSYCRSYSHTVGHTTVWPTVWPKVRSIRSYCWLFCWSYCRSNSLTVILSVIRSYCRSYCWSYGHTVGPRHGCLQLYLHFYL